MSYYYDTKGRRRKYYSNPRDGRNLPPWFAYLILAGIIGGLLRALYLHFFV